MTRRTFARLAVATVIGIPAGAAGQSGSPGAARPGWGQDVEKEFRVGRGTGPKLMTEEEWKEHHRKMQTLSGDERDRYRREMHEQMRERAKERGIAMPAEPGPHGRRGGGPGGPPKQ